MHYAAQVTPLFQRYLYRPMIRLRWSGWRTWSGRSQSGDVNLYLFYVFGVVVIAYAVYTS